LFAIKQGISKLFSGRVWKAPQTPRRGAWIQ